MSNPDGILSPAAVDSIDRMAYGLRQSGIAEIAVVAVGSIGGSDVFTFAHSLFQKWGIGSSEHNNGLLIFLVLDEREIRFITGYGLEGVLPDALCRRIQSQYMLQPFREGDWDGGMVAGVAAVGEVLRGGELASGMPEDESTGGNFLWYVFELLFVCFFLLPLLIKLAFGSRRCKSCGKRKLHRVSSRVVERHAAYSVVEETYVCRKCGASEVRRVRYYRQGRSNGRGGIGGGIGGFGGGGSFGGGFGGGMSGGGGAGSRF